MDSEDIKRIRKKRRLTQAELADLIGVSVRTVQDWDQGRYSPRGPAAAMLEMVNSGKLKKSSRE